MKHQNLYGCLVVGVLAGMGCGGLATPAASHDGPGEERPGGVRTQSATLEGDETDIEVPTSAERISRPDPDLVERVNFVPVESSGSSDESAAGLEPEIRDRGDVDTHVYDVSVQLDSDRLPEDTMLNARLLEADTSGSAETSGGDNEDGDPVPLPADWTSSADAADGESTDGDPVPLPANPGSDDKEGGSSEDGDPVPLPAEWFGGLRETRDYGASSDDGGSSGDDVETFRAEDTLLLVFPDIERPDQRPGGELLVELSSPAWSTALYLSVDE